MSIYHDYPIPVGSSKERCGVYGCVNRSEMLVVIAMPHRSLFDYPVWGKPGEMHNVAPATATIGVCRPCARRMAVSEAGWHGRAENPSAANGST